MNPEKRLIQKRMNPEKDESGKRLIRKRMNPEKDEIDNND